MTENISAMNVTTSIIIIGVFATIVMDIWTILLKRLCDITPLSYGFVGRWVIGMFDGKLCHSTIMQSKPRTGELAVGWLFHYVIGVAYAALMFLVLGDSWLLKPSFTPALVFGLCTVVAPFFIMQPCFGFGIAAANTPQPYNARLRSVKTHLVFGFGLYLGALINAPLL